MPNCNIHSQHYEMHEYCIYCGNPFKVVDGNSTVTPFVNSFTSADECGGWVDAADTRCHNKKPCYNHRPTFTPNHL